MIVPLFMTAFAGIVVLALIIRNEFVYRVRMGFIDDDSLWPESYEALPEYDTMLYIPKYWKLWTKSQWVTFVREQNEAK